jgi:spore coat polysaccharide biosynthesis protein SpsF
MKRSKAGIIIQARMSSTRLPNKVLLPFFENKSILKIILETVEPLNITSVIATSTKASDDKIEEFANKNNVPLFRGDLSNVLNRTISCAKLFGFQKVIRVCADNPFLQEIFLSEILKFDEENSDYVSHFTRDGFPVILKHFGLFPELVSVKSLIEVSKSYKSKYNEEHVTSGVYNNSDHFNINKIFLPDFLELNRSLRFTVDTAEDFSLMQKVYIDYLKNNKEIKQTIEKLDKETIRLMKRNIKHQKK